MAKIYKFEQPERISPRKPKFDPLELGLIMLQHQEQAALAYRKEKLRLIVSEPQELQESANEA